MRRQRAITSATFPGRMAKLADARDLKSRGGKPPCGFDPRSGHSFFSRQILVTFGSAALRKNSARSGEPTYPRVLPRIARISHRLS